MFANARGVAHDLMGETTERRRCRHVEVDRGGDVLLVRLGVGLLGDRKEVEDAAAAVVEYPDLAMRPWEVRLEVADRKRRADPDGLRRVRQHVVGERLEWLLAG